MNAEIYFVELPTPSWISVTATGALLLLVGVIVCAVVRKRRRP